MGIRKTGHTLKGGSLKGGSLTRGSLKGIGKDAPKEATGSPSGRPATVKVDGKALSGQILDRLDQLVAGQGDGRVSKSEVAEQLKPLLEQLAKQNGGKLSQRDLDTVEHGLAQYNFTPVAKIAVSDAVRGLGHAGLLEGAIVDRFEKVSLPQTEPLSAADTKLAQAVLREMSQSLGLRDESVLMDRLGKIGDLATQASRPAGGLEAVGVKRLAGDDISNKLSTTYGAMGDLLYLRSAEDLLARLPDIKQQAAAMSQFRSELGSAKTLNELRGLGRRWAGQRLPGQCMNELLKGMMNQAKGKDPTAFLEAARFYQEAAAKDPAYAADQIGREFYVVCLNKSGQMDASITEARAYIDDLTGKPDLTINPATVREEHRLNGEVLAGAGKALKMVADKASKGEPPSADVQQLILRELDVPLGRDGKPPADFDPASFDWARGALEVSTHYYEAGFTKDFEYYPGIVSVYQNYERGDPERAEQLAPMVYAACEAAGGKEAGDYWCLATQMELSLIIGRDQDFADILPKVLEQANVGWMLSSTVDKMSTLADQREAQGQDTTALRFAIDTLGERCKQLDAPSSKAGGGGDKDASAWITRTVGQMHQTLGTHAAKASDPTPEQVAGKARTDAVLGSTADFRALTNSHAVGGNVAYGGQIPDMTITRQSVQVVRDLLGEWGIDKIDNVADWNTAVNDKLNQIFDLQEAGGRRPLEDLHSDEHEVLDGYDNKRFQLAGTKVSGDSRTDLLAIMALGIGDCRPTGYAKQLLFDVWQHGRKNDLMHRAFDAVTTGDRGQYEDCMNKVADLDKTQLRTITCRIDAPVQMREMYDWITDDNGLPKRDPDGAFNAVENHTFNILVELDDSGHVKNDLTAADGFYHQLYPLDGLPLKASDLLEEGAYLGEKMGTKADDGQDIPFRLEPSAYSGALLKEFDVGSTDFRYCGQTVAPPTVASMLFERMRLNTFARSVAALDPARLAAEAEAEE